MLFGIFPHQAGSAASPVMVNEHVLETVDQFTYLGSTISSDLSLVKEIQTRIGKAATCFSRLRARAWSNKYLTERTKTRIYQCCVVSVLLYGSEAWSTYAQHERELNAFHMRCLRNILGITWRDKVTNEALLARTGSKSIFQTLKNARWPPAKGHRIQRAERWFQRQRTTTVALQGCRKA
ncbi:hypothetical protein JOQ06_011084 [Pogonophryne albipinna]|uniref:Uncharacterized protein n=1 Tax=Pogonophryne albipinna TaxID=1090488 RepID=A0AAD6FG77_9TELE|nr:hypothetical protein JOQ06_011084 [Pogonophryne albipinna]